MSTSIVYYPHAIYAPGVLTLSQMMEVEPNHNYSDISEFAASDPAPRFTGSHQAAPDFKFSTNEIKAVLDVLSNYDVCHDFDDVDVYLQYKAGEQRGVRLSDDNGGAGGNHLFGRMQENAFLAFESIQAQQGSLAKIRARIAAIYQLSTGNDPLVFSDDNDITIAPLLQVLYTLGPMKVNGSFLTGVTEANWENNIEYEEVFSDGDEFLSYIGIKKFRPVITIKSRNTAYIDTFGTRGTALTAFNYFLRKKLVSDIDVALATAAHINLAATKGTIKARRIDTADASCEITIDLHVADASTQPYTITSTAGAIS